MSSEPILSVCLSNSSVFSILSNAKIRISWTDKNRQRVTTIATKVKYLVQFRQTILVALKVRQGCQVRRFCRDNPGGCKTKFIPTIVQHLPGFISGVSWEIYAFIPLSEKSLSHSNWLGRHYLSLLSPAVLLRVIIYSSHNRLCYVLLQTSNLSANSLHCSLSDSM